MSDIKILADVLANYSAHRKKPGTRGGGKTHPGLRHLKNADHERIAIRLLEHSWHNTLAMRSLFQMAQSVETLLCIRISWAERFQMGRVLVSSLTYSGLYRLERDADNNQAPYYIVASGKRLSTIKQLVHRTQFGKPFPKWTEPYDQHGNQLVRPCRPVPTELEYE